MTTHNETVSSHHEVTDGAPSGAAQAERQRIEQGLAKVFEESNRKELRRLFKSYIDGILIIVTTAAIMRYFGWCAPVQFVLLASTAVFAVATRTVILDALDAKGDKTAKEAMKGRLRPPADD